MSQHRGGLLVRQSTSNKPGRPSLDRPSLFAGMDNEDSTFGGDDTQRVRILSTLESTRRSTRSKELTKIHGFTRKKRSNWQTKALMGLMGIGVLILLTSFVMVIMEGHSKADKSDANAGASAIETGGKHTGGVAPKVSADTSNPLAALIAPPPHPAIVPAPQQAAVIENVINTPAVPMPGEPKVASVSSLATHNATQSTSSEGKPVEVNRPATPVTLSTPPAAPAKPHALARDAATTGNPTQPVAKHTPASKSKDDDVALLEAMFAHTRPRPAPAPAPLSVADELKQRCGSLSGAEAATCRARVCVQNPTAAACHQD